MNYHNQTFSHTQPKDLSFCFPSMNTSMRAEAKPLNLSDFIYDIKSFLAAINNPIVKAKNTQIGKD